MSTKLNWNGKILTLKDDAFIDGTYDDQYYTAFATDENDNDYKIRWEIINTETENEDECCDWDDFAVTEL